MELVQRWTQTNGESKQVFQSGYSTTYHIHINNQVIEKYVKYAKPLCMVFIDYEKAFESMKISGDRR